MSMQGEVGGRGNTRGMRLELIQVFDISADIEEDPVNVNGLGSPLSHYRYTFTAYKMSKYTVSKSSNDDC
jgi:hypothetical protein